MKEYYWLLRSALRTKPALRACLTRCRHCRIFFLTHPRNAAKQRHKVRCPFGCREAHRKQESTRRSVAYYRHPTARQKKIALNQRRTGKSSRAAASCPRPPVRKGSAAKSVSLIVEHVRMVVSLIEGRPISRSQVLSMVAKVLRQHTMCRIRRIDQAVVWLLKHPP